MSHMKEGHPLHVYDTKMIWGDTYEGSMVGQNAAHHKGMPRAKVAGVVRQPRVRERSGWVGVARCAMPVHTFPGLL